MTCIVLQCFALRFYVLTGKVPFGGRKGPTCTSETSIPQGNSILNIVNFFHVNSAILQYMRYILFCILSGVIFP